MDDGMASAEITLICGTVSLTFTFHNALMVENTSGFEAQFPVPLG